MLSSLTIRNVVLIEQLTVSFSGGFCALTGETGAGKSILLDSLGLALGGRADAGLVRKGADQASVIAEFHIAPDHPVHRFLDEQGLDSETTLILRRVLNSDGRSRAFINDQPVSVGILRQTGDLLVEVHGQFDTHGLLDPSTHRELLDAYAGVDARAIIARYDAWRAAREQRDIAAAEAEKIRAEEEYLRHVTDELDKLAPEDGEEERLSLQREGLRHRAQIVAGYDEAWQAISGEQGAEMAVSRASRILEKLAGRAPDDMDPMIAALDRAATELQEAVGLLESCMNRFQDGEMSAEALDDRIHALRAAARKHQVRPDELPQVHETLRHQLERLERSDDILSDLDRTVETARRDYEQAARAASKARHDAAARLDRLVAAELPPLKLDKARFVTDVQDLPDTQWGPHGLDRVQFLVATNPGSAPGPLNKIASGGEMSRFMLAVKVVMAAVGSADSYIFDEVDSGIGGATAAAVGERLARLAATRQVLVVTHSPQVAARAGNHWIVAKQGQTDVRTNVVPLKDAAERRDEIARMLSGEIITDEARAAAQRLLDTGS